MEISRIISKYLYADDTQYYRKTYKTQDVRILTTRISSDQPQLGKKTRF